MTCRSAHTIKEQKKDGTQHIRNKQTNARVSSRNQQGCNILRPEPIKEESKAIHHQWVDNYSFVSKIRLGLSGKSVGTVCFHSFLYIFQTSLTYYNSVILE